MFWLLSFLYFFLIVHFITFVAFFFPLHQFFSCLFHPHRDMSLLGLCVVNASFDHSACNLSPFLWQLWPTTNPSSFIFINGQLHACDHCYILHADLTECSQDLMETLTMFWFYFFFNMLLSAVVWFHNYIKNKVLHLLCMVKCNTYDIIGYLGSLLSISKVLSQYINLNVGNWLFLATVPHWLDLGSENRNIR